VTTTAFAPNSDYFIEKTAPSPKGLTPISGGHKEIYHYVLGLQEKLQKKLRKRYSPSGKLFRPNIKAFLTFVRAGE
jgi:hypothetical protein